MTPLLRTAALAVAAAATAWPVAAHLGDPEPRQGRAAQRSSATAVTAPATSLPWSAGRHAGPGELDAVHFDRLEASLTRLYAMRPGHPAPGLT